MRKQPAERESAYRFAPELALERFADGAILFVAARDALLTINPAAADLFAAALAAFDGRVFDRSAAAEWLQTTYALTADQVPERLTPLLAFALRHGILLRTSARPR